MRRSISALVLLTLASAGTAFFPAQAETPKPPHSALVEAPTLPADWPPDYPQTLLDAVLASEDLVHHLESLAMFVDERGSIKDAKISDADYANRLSLLETTEQAIQVTRTELEGLEAMQALPVAETFEPLANHWRLSDNLAKIRFLLTELERLSIKLAQVGTI